MTLKKPEVAVQPTVNHYLSLSSSGLFKCNDTRDRAL